MRAIARGAQAREAGLALALRSHRVAVVGKLEARAACAAEMG
jgi:hypothetical protein